MPEIIRPFRPSGPPERSIATIYAFLIAANVIAWACAISAFHQSRAVLSLAALAYVFGLRHAFDADHIAAIDNVVRKLMQQGKDGSSVGLFFSLGHSTVVVLACALIAAAAAPLQHALANMHDIGAFAGTAISALFLLLIGAANLLVLRGIWIAFRTVRLRQAGVGDAANSPPLGSGPILRLVRPLLRLISRPWHTYLVGLLFGLGFDTATEVGLLSISAQGSLRGQPFVLVLIFPALFTAAMSLLDTTDSLLMTRAYGWAFLHPLRKIWYNLTITAASVVVALCIGGIEALGLIGERFGFRGAFWDVVAGLNGDLSSLGYLMVAVFLGSWLLSIAVYRLKRYEMSPVE